MMTHKEIMVKIMRHNSGSRALNTDLDVCAYITKDGNRCAIGCFLPRRLAKQYADVGSVTDLINADENLIDFMPSKSKQWLLRLQEQHDTYEGKYLHHTLNLWLALNPPPDAPANYLEY